MSYLELQQMGVALVVGLGLLVGASAVSTGAGHAGSVVVACGL